MKNLLRRTAVVLVLLAATTGWSQEPQADQGGLGGYDALNVLAGEMESSLSGAIQSLTGGAEVTLLSDDPNKESLPIRAQTITFTYDNPEDKRPSGIVLEGGVAVDHPQGKVRSQKAVWDLKAGVLVFTGNPVMSMPQAQEVNGDEMTLNFNEDKIKVKGIRIKELRFGETMAGGEPTDPAFLKEGDILDWPAFLKAIKTQSAANEPSPGKHIVSMLDPEARAQIAAATPEQLLQNKGAVLKQVNKVLAKPGLYNKEAWGDVDLPQETKDLLAQDIVDASQQTRLNRALVEAAFPGLVAKQAKS